jgi:hypothetical protein
MSGWMHEELERASPDVLRSIVSSFEQVLMGAEADALWG